MVNVMAASSDISSLKYCPGLYPIFKKLKSDIFSEIFSTYNKKMTLRFDGTSIPKVFMELEKNIEKSNKSLDCKGSTNDSICVHAGFEQLKHSREYTVEKHALRFVKRTVALKLTGVSKLEIFQKVYFDSVGSKLLKESLAPISVILLKPTEQRWVELGRNHYDEFSRDHN